MNENTLKVLFSGDFAPCRGFENIVLEKKEEVFNDALCLIKNADLSFVNLECPLTITNEAIQKSGPTLKADPRTIEALKYFSVVGLANNHIYDYGSAGLEDTLKACNSQSLETVGAGMSLEEAQKILVLERKGVKVAIIALAEYEFNQSENGEAGSAPIDLVDNYHQIKKAKELADIVIITIHGGNEYFPYPRPKLRKLCKHYIDLGVNAVICHHPHVPGSYEVYKGMPIFYSIGNLIFDNKKPRPDWDKGYFVQLNIDINDYKLTEFEIIPYSQSVSEGGVRLLKAEEKEHFIDRIENYKVKLECNAEYLKIWDNYIEKNTSNYILRNYTPIHFRGISFITRRFPFLLNVLFGKRSTDLDRLNVIRCQSHLELFAEVLKKKIGSKYK